MSSFGNVVDYFGFGSNELKPISSSSGDNLQRVCCANATTAAGVQSDAGRFSSGINAVGGVWRNPTVTYKVVGNKTFTTQLGRAYDATFTGTGSSRRMTVSGYMISGVRVSTNAGAFPTITVTAVANEGANAINLFGVSITVQARSRAQNLLDAVSGGGQLQSCTITAECTPVVLAENMMPCASDVVGGRYSVAAVTAAPNGESAPTAGGGFTIVGKPSGNGDREYPTWEIKAQKEIV